MGNKQKVSTIRAVSAALTALLLFAALNAWLSINRTRFNDRYQSPFRGWSYWSVQAMHNVDGSHINVVFLGSSLVVAAVAECDALVKNRSFDLCFYRGAQYFDEQMRKCFGQPYQTMDLATPGQIPSDAYLTLKTALANGINPGIVIYGIAPRDFIDHTLNDAGDTEPFHYLSRLVTIDECKDDLLSEPMGQVEWKLKQALKLVDDAPAILSAIQPTLFNSVQSADYNLFGQAQKHLMEYSLHRLSPEYQSPDIHPGSAMAQVQTKRLFLDNIEDYKCRYKFPNEKNYAVQMRFLDRLIALCQSHDIDIVLVNMPITKRNMDILEPSWRDRYFNDVHRLAQLHKVPLLDQCQFEAYSPDDFRDTVHLNGFGGRKFIDLLVDRLAQRPDTKQVALAAGTRKKRSVTAVSDPRSGIEL